MFNTRFTLLELSGILDDDTLRRRSRSGSDLLDSLHEILAFKNFAKNNVAAIKPRCHDGRDEELRSIGVFASICHREKEWLVVLQLEIFISKLGTVNRFATNASSVSKVST